MLQISPLVSSEQLRAGSVRARSPFLPSRPPVFRWHVTASRPRSAESGLGLKLRNSLMHGPFPRMHGRLPRMHAPFPLFRRPFAGIRLAFARMNDALAGMHRSLGCLGRSLTRCAGRNDASPYIKGLTQSRKGAKKEPLRLCVRLFLSSGQNGPGPPRTIAAKERIERKEFFVLFVFSVAEFLRQKNRAGKGRWRKGIGRREGGNADYR